MPASRTRGPDRCSVDDAMFLEVSALAASHRKHQRVGARGGDAPTAPPQPLNSGPATFVCTVPQAQRTHRTRLTAGPVAAQLNTPHNEDDLGSSPHQRLRCHLFRSSGRGLRGAGAALRVEGGEPAEAAGEPRVGQRGRRHQPRPPHRHHGARPGGRRVDQQGRQHQGGRRRQLRPRAQRAGRRARLQGRLHQRPAQLPGQVRG